jgi:Bifunctional DNA primase/polymerase, N-terminal
MTYGWPQWFGAFGGELVSVIPAHADSDTIAKPLRGKCPGTRKPDGKWVGTAGAMADRLMTLEEAKIAHRTGAVIGMLGRVYPALDIDVEDDALASEIEKHAFATLGLAPVRTRVGSARRLLLYAGTGLRRHRIEFRPPGHKEEDKPWAVELLATGQYFNVCGIHPSGQPYEWRGEHPCALGPYGLTEIGEEAVKACL